MNADALAYALLGAELTKARRDAAEWEATALTAVARLIEVRRELAAALATIDGMHRDVAAIAALLLAQADAPALEWGDEEEAA